MKKLETEIIINASSNEVWSVLMDHQSYRDWNPFIQSISGQVNPGNFLQVELMQDNGKVMKFEPEVLINKKESEFRWKGKLFVKGLFDGEHYFILEQLTATSTRFIHGEVFSGVLVPVLLGMMGKSILESFEKMNLALKLRTESKAKMTA